MTHNRSDHSGLFDLSGLLAMLRAHTPIDERERDSIERFITEVPTLDEPFNEHAHPLHVTASAIVVDSLENPTHTVLHLHKRLNIWLQPGGHIESGESPAEAAMREAVEETGLTVAHPSQGEWFVHVDVHPGPRGHTHFDLRYVLCSPLVPPSPPVGESSEVRWFPRHEAQAIADDGLAGALRRLWPA